MQVRVQNAEAPATDFLAIRKPSEVADGGAFGVLFDAARAQSAQASRGAEGRPPVEAVRPTPQRRDQRDHRDDGEDGISEVGAADEAVAAVTRQKAPEESAQPAPSANDEGDITEIAGQADASLATAEADANLDVNISVMQVSAAGAGVQILDDANTDAAGQSGSIKRHNDGAVVGDSGVKAAPVTPVFVDAKAGAGDEDPSMRQSPTPTRQAAPPPLEREEAPAGLPGNKLSPAVAAGPENSSADVKVTDETPVEIRPLPENPTLEAKPSVQTRAEQLKPANEVMPPSEQPTTRDEKPAARLVAVEEAGHNGLAPPPPAEMSEFGGESGGRRQHAESEPVPAVQAGVRPSESQETPRAAETFMPPRPAPVSPSDMAENAERIVRMARAAHARGESRIQLRLEPPELGVLRVEIRHSAQGLQLRLETGNAQTEQLLRQNIHELRAALDAQGMNSAQIDVQLRPEMRGESQPRNPDQPPPGFDQGGRQSHQQQQTQQSPQRPDVDAGPWPTGDDALGDGVDTVTGWRQLQFAGVDVIA